MSRLNHPQNQISAGNKSKYFAQGHASVQAAINFYGNKILIRKRGLRGFHNNESVCCCLCEVSLSFISFDTISGSVTEKSSRKVAPHKGTKLIQV